MLYLDSRERGALRSAHAQSALDTLSAEAALAIENARLSRSVDKAKFEQELKVTACHPAVAAADREPRGALRPRPSIACRAVGATTTTSICRRPSSASSSETWREGSPAALLAAAVLGMFSAEATYQAGAAPLMTRLNRLFRAIETRFRELYGISDPRSLTYCNGAQRAAIVSASGIRRLETGGVVLGLFDHASYEKR